MDKKKRNRKVQDLTGMRFNELTALEYVGDKKWRCKCSCGKETIVSSCHLKSGHTKSCGHIVKAERFEDLSGQIFGRWEVIRPGGTSKSEGRMFWCRCECGTEKLVSGHSLKLGRSKSCGCLGEENRIRACTHHGCARTVNGVRPNKLYTIWSGMRDRCNNSSNVGYQWYGAKGVSVCEEWNNSFETFNEWANNNGYREGLSIDRINPFGNYEPSNCRWITLSEQAYNKRNSKCNKELREEYEKGINDESKIKNTQA